MIRLLLLAAFLVACSKKDHAGPSCDQVVDRMLELTKQMIPGHDPQSLGDRTQMIDQCKQRNMPAEVRACIVAAKNLDDLATCHRKGNSTAKPEAAPPPSAPPAPAPTPAPTRPLPTGSNGSDGG
jgi:hypothetical protein